MAIYADKKDGKLTGRFRVEVQVNGKRARGRFSTLEEAREAEALWRTSFPLTAAVERHDQRGVPHTLKDLVARANGELWRGKESRELTEARLARMVALLGPNTPLKDLDTPSLDRVVNHLFQKKLQTSTINKHLSALHRLLKWGKDRKWLSELPVFPWQDDDEEGRIRWITPAEEAQLLSLLPPDIATLTRIAIVTGMRRGELLELELKQVEPNWVRLWKTKTKQPRSVPISMPIFNDLYNLVERGMPSRYTLRYHWDRAREAMGLSNDPWFTFHVTRHTCATRLVQANVNLRLIQKWLGHKRIETTIRYAQVSDTMLRDAHQQAEVFLGAPLDTSPTVGYRPSPDTAATSYRNPRMVKMARNRLKRPSLVERMAMRHAGVVKLADTQDLGSCKDHNDLNNLEEKGEVPEGD